MRAMLKMIWSLLIFALVAYVVIMVGLFFLQRQMIYGPDRRDFTLAMPAEPEYQVITTETADGLTLRHMWAEPNGAEAPVFLVFHGNAGHIGHRSNKFGFLAGTGAGQLLAEYRGYGGNPGSPDEKGLYADGRSVLDWLANEGISPDRIVLYGESLGSGVATKIAAELSAQGTPPRALVLEAPFTSVPAVAQRRFWWLPATWLTLDRFDNLSRIADIDTEILIVHGTADRVVPYDMGVALADAAGPRARFLSLEGAGHLELLDFDEVKAALLELARADSPALPGSD